MYENDLFIGEDQYYTQGSIVEFMHPVFGRSPLAKILLKVSNGSFADHLISFRQDVFTPSSIRNRTLDTTDRPYAGSFFLSQKCISHGIGFRLTSSIDIGLMGPGALGEQMQKTIHKYTNNAEPLGWENQVANSFIANYNLWGQLPIVDTHFFTLIAEAGGKAGILYTNAGGGLMIRLGKMPLFGRYIKQSRWDHKWDLFATLNGTATYVQYNAVLQGVPWTKSVHVLTKEKIERMLYKMEFSLNFSIKRVSFIYTTTFITPEIKEGMPHGWGGINFVYRF